MTTSNPGASLVALLATTILAAGCGTSYVAPTTGPVASVAFVPEGQKHYNISVVQFHGDEYRQSRGQVLGGLNSVAIGLPDITGKPLTIRAGEPFRFQVMGGGNALAGETMGTYLCLVHMQFVPGEGKAYRVTYVLNGDSPCDGRVQMESDGMLVPLVPPPQRFASCVDPRLTSAAFDGLCTDDFVLREVRGNSGTGVQKEAGLPD